MIATSWWHWGIGLTSAVVAHGAILIGLPSQDAGDGKPRPAQPMSVAASMSDVMGEPVEIAGVAPDFSPSTIQAVEPEAVQVVSADTDTLQHADLQAVAASEVPDDLKSIPSTDVAVLSSEALPPMPVRNPMPKAEREKAAPQQQAREAAPRRGERGQRNQRLASRGSGVPSSGQSNNAPARAGATAGLIRSYGMQVRQRILSRVQSTAGPGRAVVSVGVTTSGGLAYARLARSSGNASVDRAALNAVRRAAPFPRPPRGAKSSQLRFSVPMVYR